MAACHKLNKILAVWICKCDALYSELSDGIPSNSDRTYLDQKNTHAMICALISKKIAGSVVIPPSFN